MNHSASSTDFASLQQAAQWYALLRADDASERDRLRWREWVEAHPQHRQAWSHVENVSRQFDPLAASTERRAATIALDAADRPAFSRRQLLGALMAVPAAGWLAADYTRHGLLSQRIGLWTADHTTAVGEIREITLADGTRLWLNTQSAVDVEFSATQRLLRLRAGEILIATAHDEAQREFVVATRAGSLRPLGTRFGVRLDGEATRLSVFEGAVEIRSARSNRRLRLDAGQQASFTSEAIGPIETADAAGEAWSRGSLRADDVALCDFLAELGRYRRGYLGCAPAIAGLRVMGTYPLHDSDRALTMLEHALPVRVERRLPWWVSVEAVAE